MDFDTNPAATTAMTTGNTSTMNNNINTNSSNNNNNDIDNNNSNNNNNNNNMSASETTNPTATTNMLAAFMASSPILKTEYDIDVIRLIGQHLSSLGLKQTVSLLLQESGLQKLDHPLPERFKDHIMSGEWAEATALVDELAQLITSAPQSSINRLANIPTDSQTLVTAPTSNHQSPTLGCGSSFEINSAPMMVSSPPPPLPPPPPPQAATAGDPMFDCELDLTDKSKIANAIRLAVAEQKFLEYLEEGHHLKACRCLRLEISPFRDVEYVQHLTTLLMCKSPEEFRSKANWPGKGLKSRQLVVERIQRYIPPLISLPPRRLDTLLQQALQLQRDRCILHIPRGDDNQQLVELHNSNSSMAARGSIESTTSSTGSNNMILNGSDDFTGNNNNCNNTSNAATQHTNGHTAAATTTTSSSSATTTTPSSSPSSMSLFTAAGGVASTSQYNKQFADLKQDHTCAVDKFPLQARQQIDTHKSEVWFCSFSNDGTRLATGGLGGKVKIWHLDPVERQLVEKCTLDCNSYSVTCLSWSPNGTYLLVCGPEDRPDLWIWNVNKEEVHNMISLSENESATTCSWHMSGERFAAASIKGNFHTFDLDGNRLGAREGVRVQCLSFLNKDPNFILAADTLRRIKAYSVKDMSLDTYEEDILEERHPIMSFVIDKQDRFIAVHLEKQGIHLWDYKLKTLVRMFPGVMQRNMTIFSSFSGLDSRFLASGSEDGKVYIYNVNKDQPVVLLYGHSRCVNCVAWNPRYPEMLVSVSDDRTVRLWAPMESPSLGTPHPQLRSHPPTYALSSNSNNSGHLC